MCFNPLANLDLKTSITAQKMWSCFFFWISFPRIMVLGLRGFPHGALSCTGPKIFARSHARQRSGNWVRSFQSYFLTKNVFILLKSITFFYSSKLNWGRKRFKLSTFLDLNYFFCWKKKAKILLLLKNNTFDSIVLTFFPNFSEIKNHWCNTVPELKTFLYGLNKKNEKNNFLNFSKK